MSENYISAGMVVLCRVCQSFPFVILFWQSSLTWSSGRKDVCGILKNV